MQSNIKGFAVYAGERALKTLAQTALALIIAAHGVLDVSWVHVGDVAGLAMIVSILTSLVSATGGTVPAARPATVVSPDPETDLSVDAVTDAVNRANDPDSTQQIPVVPAA
jgi:Putative lactococcus lactis phage r1t holin